MTVRTNRVAGPVALAAAGAVALALALSQGSPPAVGAGTAASAMSAGLAAQPDVDRVSTVRYAADEARAQAGRRAAEVPLPAGGNFHGVHWEEAGGTFSVAEIEGVVEYNAFCQWLRAAQGPRREEALAVLDSVPRWPALRGGDGVVAQAVAEARTGGGRVHAGVLAACVRSHQDEAAYAAKRGLTPST
jgi:hypothetical protein